MPSDGHECALSPDDRRRELIGILAHGVTRWCRAANTKGIIANPELPDFARNSLEVPSETRLSVSRTRGLRPRDDGDNA